MPARVPQDVDLEDKLVFGLSPLRFGYVVIGLIVAAGVWAAQWPPPLPALAILPVAAGAALAVGRWHGHRIDTLAWDIGVHCARNYHLELSKDLDALVRRGHPKLRKGRNGRVVTVTALDSGVGATTMALELAVGLALSGEPVQLWEPGYEIHLRLGLAAQGRHEASGLELLDEHTLPVAQDQIVVRSIPAGELVEPAGLVVLVLAPGTDAPDGVLPLVNRGASSDPATPAVPDDPHIQRAEALRESALIAFPDAPASRVLRTLAASLRELVNE